MDEKADMKKMCTILCFLILSSFLTDCDYKDIDRRIFIVAIGIDHADSGSGLTLTFKGAIPPRKSQSQSSNENYQLIQVEADSIGLGLRKVKEQLSLEPDYSHMKTLLFGKSFIDGNKDQLVHIAKFFILRRDFQNLMWITMANPSAKEILDFQSSTENYAGAEIYMRFGQGVDSPYNCKKKLSEFYTELTTPGLTTLMPIFEKFDGKIKMANTAIFTKDVNSHSVIHDEEIKILNILLNKTPNSAFIYSIEDKDKIVGFNLKGAKTKYSFNNEKNKLICNLDVKLKLLSEEGTEYHLSKEEAGKLIQSQIKSKILKLLDKFQQEKADPLNLELSYWEYRPNYDLSDDWINEYYTRIQFKVNVYTSLEGKSSAR